MGFEKLFCFKSQTAFIRLSTVAALSFIPSVQNHSHQDYLKPPFLNLMRTVQKQGADLAFLVAAQVL
jgi:hypothetical protein